MCNAAMLQGPIKLFQASPSSAYRRQVQLTFVFTAYGWVSYLIRPSMYDKILPSALVLLWRQCNIY